MTLTRIVAHLPNGARQGPLPTPQDMSASYVLNDLGALTFSYPPTAPLSSLLGQPLELVTEVSTDRGLTWAEPKGGRFLYLTDGRDPVKDDAFQVEAPSYLKRLAKALVPFTGLNGEGQREFAARTPGYVLHTLFTEAQARGAMTGMAWDFTATADSAGVAWPSTLNVAYEAGKDFLAVLQGLADQGYVDFTANGRTVQAYITDSAGGLSADRTTGTDPVSLREGRDVTEAPFRRTWEGLADTAFIQGDGTSTLTRTNATALKPWGRQETFVTASGVTDAGTLQVLGDVALGTTASVRVEWTYGLVFPTAVYLPFAHYFPGNWVFGAPDGNAPTRMRVRQITLTGDGGNVVLNDRFLEADVRAARTLEKITNGATASGSGTAPSGVGNDILPPAAPSTPIATSTAYVDGGQSRAQVSLDWADVTTNMDGSPISDLAGYQVWRRPSGGVWALASTTDTSAWNDSPYQVGTTWEFKVRAIDTVNNVSVFSGTVTRVMATDTTPPPVPSKPTLSARLGSLVISWDGLTSAAAVMTGTADFQRVDAYLSTASGFTPPGAGARVASFVGPGQTTIAGLPYNVAQFVRLIAVDTSQNASGPSVQETVTIVPLVNTDLIGQVIDGARLVDGTVTASDKIVANTVTGALIQALAIDAGKLAANAVTADKILAGAVTAGKVAAQAIDVQNLRIGSFDNLIVNPGFEDGVFAPHDAIAASGVTGSMDGVTMRSGAWAGRLTFGTAFAGNFDALTFNGPAGTRIAHPAVRMGDSVTLSIWVRLNSGAASLRAGVKFRDAAGSLVATVSGAPVALAAGVWTELTITATATLAASAYAAFYLQGTSVTVGTTVQVDDAYARMMVTGNLIVDGAIDGKTITAPLLRTAATGKRVEITGAVNDRVSFYDGTTNDPGSMLVYVQTSAGLRPALTVAPPHSTSGVYGYPSVLLVGASGTMAGEVQIDGGSAFSVSMEDSIYLDAPTNGIAINATHALKGIDFGFTTVTCDASGLANIAHGLGAVPAIVLCQISGTGTNFKTQVTARAAGNFTVKLVNSSTNALAPVSSQAGIYWLAIL